MSADSAAESKSGLRTIVVASAAGTTFEWYDFFIFGALTTIIAQNFYAGVSGTVGTILTLLTFAVGFIARPLGAMIFGHIGDKKGRKGTFLWTIIIMGVATILIGCLPTYAQAGPLAPVLLVGLRILQGIAMGGEYGGAAIYVAEHAPTNRRGLYTSWIQCSAGFGLLAALAVVMVTRSLFTPGAFADWGWRIPFLVSTGLLIVSVYIRAKTAESPAFKALHAEGAIARSPLSETFTHWPHMKGMLIALFGFMTAQGVVWYTSFFYTQVFLEKIVKLAPEQKDLLVIGMTLVSAPLYILFAWLSDRIGRKPVMIAGIAVACLAFFPGFNGLMKFGNPDFEAASRASPVVIVADPAQCTFQFDLFSTGRFATPCDLAKSTVTGLGVPYTGQADSPGTASATVRIGDAAIVLPSGQGLDAAQIKAVKAKAAADIRAAMIVAGYPEKADPEKANLPAMFVILCIFAIGAAALYGPMAAALVEMFPTRVRYTAMSLPYNIGTGWFGGLQPALSFAIVAATGNLYWGLWYTVGVGALAIVVAAVFMKETRGRDLQAME